MQYIMPNLLISLLFSLISFISGDDYHLCALTLPVYVVHPLSVLKCRVEKTQDAAKV